MLLKPERKLISITQLFLNHHNPRFDEVESQREAIHKMIEEQGVKIVNLASDIVENGLNPSELTIVASKDGNDGYTVLEGNRRVVALKLLSNPSILNDNNKSIRNRFIELEKNFRKNQVKEVECVVFHTEDDANHWIKLKHTGENDGIGTVRWNSHQVARFDERLSQRKRLSLQAIDFLQAEPSVKPELKEKLTKLPTTSMDRLLSDKNVQEALGVTVKEGTLESDLQPNEVAKGLSKIAEDLISKKIKVKDIYRSDDREKYIETFEKDELPKREEKTDSEWKIADAPNKELGKKEEKKQKRSVPQSSNRKSLIPRGCIIRIKEDRLNDIYYELKRIDIDSFVNAVSVLFRVFLELTLDEMIEKKQLTGVTVDNKLTKKIDSVANYLQDAKIMTEKELKAIRALPTNPNSIASVDTMHSYVHNRLHHPSPSELKITWDNIQLFFERTWEALE